MASSDRHREAGEPADAAADRSGASQERATGLVLERLAELEDANQRLREELERQHGDGEALRRAAIVFDNAAEGVLVTDADTRILDVNRAFCEVTGYSHEEVAGRTPRILRSGRHGRRFYEEMWAALGERGRWHGEIWNRRKDGEVYPELLSISAVCDGSGRVSHYVGVFSDISLLKASEARYQRLAQHDVLTGLPNRLLLADRLENALARARVSGREVALLFLDLDRFKDVNDALGHAAGDELLRAVAGRLEAAVRPDETVARLGGDEFTVLLVDQESFHAAGALARRLLRTLAEPFDVGGTEVFISACIGISAFPRDGDDISTLLKHADTAMYRAKERGRGSFIFYTAELTDRARRRLETETDLRRAVERDEIELHYQPFVRLDSGRVVGVEGLLRWQHPSLGLLLPDRFLDLAEDTGLIELMSERALRSGCECVRRWREAGLGELRLAMNVSGRQVGGARLLDMVMRVMDETGFTPEWLELEVTEGFMLSRPERALFTLQALRSLGIRLALDDFGTGFSSLGHLKRLPVGRLKIDRTFVTDLASNQQDDAIARAILDLGRSLGLQVTAEGVETAGQARFLRELGCDEAQGFHFYRPIPASELEALLRTGAAVTDASGSRAGEAAPPRG
jgi:diguanylate cyclase (GGDEF)-like protein/PAS domain S-box-containing protein